MIDQLRTYDALDSEHLVNLLREARKQLPASGIRDRIDSVVIDPELSCAGCGHYLWNHNADGPCAVREGAEDACRCGDGVGTRLGAVLAVLRSVVARLSAVQVPLVALLVAWVFIVGGLLVLG